MSESIYHMRLSVAAARRYYCKMYRIGMRGIWRQEEFFSNDPQVTPSSIEDLAALRDVAVMDYLTRFAPNACCVTDDMTSRFLMDGEMFEAEMIIYEHRR